MTQAKVYITADGDPQIGNFLTPINNSPAIKFFIDWLPINRPGLGPISRGLEIGMAHGYWLVGPFTQLGPLRSEPVGTVVGLLGGLQYCPVDDHGALYLWLCHASEGDRGWGCQRLE